MVVAEVVEVVLGVAIVWPFDPTSDSFVRPSAAFDLASSPVSFGNELPLDLLEAPVPVASVRMVQVVVLACSELYMALE